jgi:hypothetical protein
MKWVGYTAHMRETENAYKIKVGTPEGNTPLERPRHLWDYNIKMEH